ncbi:MAG: CDP-diacylglycerol--glycerol-3-phosphate 3-phosphatidyltransferase [Tissierellia bacterium]|nr:CDP-diacylglycerol--glycerol-3-phosphate 3-phosphatidyltransferase [Tissierellia bacterium]
MNIPNIITIFRMFLIPVFLYVFYSEIENYLLWSGLILLMAGISDVADGYIARKYDLRSKLGAVLDPLADKLMSFTVLSTYAFRGLIPMWILKLLTVKELLLIIGGGRLFFNKKNIVIPANKFGKIATFFFYISIAAIVFKLPDELIGILLTLTVIINIISFINYLNIYVNIRSKKIE